MNIVFVAMFRILEAMFVIGVAGCVVAIPIVAYRMLSVLIERDDDSLESEEKLALGPARRNRTESPPDG